MRVQPINSGVASGLDRAEQCTLRDGRTLSFDAPEG